MREKIFEGVREIIMEVLNADASEVTEEATLSSLGAESIFYLDIIFRVEKKFGIKIPRGEFFPKIIFTYPLNIGFVEEGKVNNQGIRLMKKEMPFLDISKFKKDPVLSKINDLYTVGALVNFVEMKLKLK